MQIKRKKDLGRENWRETIWEKEMNKNFLNWRRQDCTNPEGTHCWNYDRENIQLDTFYLYCNH